jgi:regulator of cell morphogenesis and NO signaling
MSPTEITKDTPVGQIAAAAPLATRVFARHGIDFCCGGGVPLEAACADRDLQVDAVLEEIDGELRASDEAAVSWEGSAPDALIEHILETYHRPLDEELPRLEAMARKVHMVHGEKDPERLGALVATFTALKAELEQHMAKEEQILFPMIREGHSAMAGGPISVMHAEHDDAGAALRKLRELTDDYTPPAGACNTWRALWHGLADLERSLHEHIHLENNVLFPAVLRS